MWFEVLAWILAIACFVKAFVGFVFHDAFYDWDRRQYASKGWPVSFTFFLPYGIGMVIAVWYATIFHYVQYGWILTTLVTIASVKLVNILLNWKKTSAGFVAFIEKGGAALWFVDVFVLAVGIGSAALAIWVY